MRIRIVFGAAATAALVACSSGRPRGPLSDGERVYLARCTACHAAYEPEERSPAEWTAAVAKMERWKKVTLTPGDRSLILGYLTGSAPSAPPAAAPAPRG